MFLCILTLKSAFWTNILLNVKFMCWCLSIIEDGGSSAVRVTNEEALQRPKEERNILHKIQGRKDYWHGHSLRRKCLLKHVIETKTWGFCVKLFCSKLCLCVKEE